MTGTSTYLSGPGGSFIREHKLICKSVAVNDEGDYFVVYILDIILSPYLFSLELPMVDKRIRFFADSSCVYLQPLRSISQA